MTQEKSDAEILENLGKMAQWNAAQDELRRHANGDMLKFRDRFLEWMARHWELMTPFALKMRQLEERAVRAEKELGDLRKRHAHVCKWCKSNDSDAWWPWRDGFVCRNCAIEMQL